MKLTKKNLIIFIVIFVLIVTGALGVFLKLGMKGPKSANLPTLFFTLNQEFMSTEDMAATNPTGTGMDESYYSVNGLKYFYDPDNNAYIDEGTFCMRMLNQGVVPVVGALESLDIDGSTMAGTYSYDEGIYYWNSSKGKWAEADPAENTNGKLNLVGYSNNVSAEIIPLMEQSTEDDTYDELDAIVSDEIRNEGLVDETDIDDSTIPEDTQTVDESAIYNYINNRSGSTPDQSYPSYSQGVAGPKGDTGSKGDKGATGATGPAGIAGKSAYQIAQSAGYKGTEKEWVASLSGQSAYQLAVKYGYKGTEKDWVASLKPASLYETAKANGFTGTASDFLKNTTGKSAYEIAVAGGYKGSESAWIASLAGKSAYQSAVDSGFKGTEKDWIESLQGATVYDLAVKSGYKGTEAAFIASLKGLSAYELAVNNGYVGTEKQWLESLKSVQTDVTVNGKTQTPGTKDISITASDILTANQIKLLAAFEGFDVDLTGMQAGDVLAFVDGKIKPVKPATVSVSSGTPELGTAIVSKTDPGEGYVCVNTTMVMNDTTPLYGVVLPTGPNAAALKASQWFADSTITSTDGIIVPCYKFIYSVLPSDVSKFYIYVGVVATTGDTKVAADGTIS